jgi:hypothetical protein
VRYSHFGVAHLTSRPIGGKNNAKGKKTMLKVLASTLLLSSFAIAGPISVNSGTATATVQFDSGFNVVSIDVRSDAILDVQGVGLVATTDFGLPSPNTNLLVLDLGVTQAVLAGLVNPSFSPDLLTLLLESTGVPIFGTITDPGVAAFLQTVTYTFTLTNFDSAGLVGTYTLESAAAAGAVPEPSSIVFSMIGFGALALLRRRRS